jgi:hypothetical protein
MTSKFDTSKIATTKDSMATNGIKTFKHTTVETIKYEHKDDNNFCNCPLILHLIWPISIIFISCLFRNKIPNLFERIKSFKFQGLEFTLSGEPLETSSTNISLNIADPDYRAMKEILCTFWKYQKNYESIKHMTRHVQNLEFNPVIKKLLWQGYITFSPKISQYFLTDMGIIFCQKNCTPSDSN